MNNTLCITIHSLFPDTLKMQCKECFDRRTPLIQLVRAVFPERGLARESARLYWLLMNARLHLLV